MKVPVPILRALLLGIVLLLSLLQSGAAGGTFFFAAVVCTTLAVSLEQAEVSAVLGWVWTLAFATSALGLLTASLDEAPSLDRLALLLLGAVVATSRNQIAGVLVSLMASGALVYVAISQELAEPQDPRLLLVGLLLLGAGTAMGLAQEESDETARLRLEVTDLGEHLRNVLTCVANGVLVVDREGRVTTYNRMAERILGLPGHRVMGRSMVELPALDPLQQVLVNNDGQDLALEGRRDDVAYRRPDGREIRLGCALTSLENRAGRRLGAILVFQDVTLLRDYEQRMRHQEKLAALGQLVSGIAHEFGNQLGGARGLVDLAMLDEPEEAIKSLPMVRETLDHSLTTVEHLLRFARGTPLQLTPGVQIGEVIDRSLSLLKAQIESAGLVVERSGGPTPPVSADAVQLEQVFLNLIINAIHATADRDPARLNITEASEGGQVVLRFEDNGPGVEADQRDRIFEPFFTTKGALAGSETPGTGLGLARASGVVGGHDGTLTVGVSASLAGACFEVRLPSTKGDTERKG